MPPRPAAPPRADPPVPGNADMGRILAERMFSRAAGAALVEGNAVRLLRDAEQNYPAWLDAIAGARHRIDFENYIFRDDPIGNRFTQALAERARAGIRVRVLLDWLGSYRAISRRQCRELRAAGAELRFFNPPRLDQPLGWLSRNHRKTVTVDGTVGFVAGLCVGQMWVGGAGAAGRPPWRDTGVEVRGPAVADLVRAFAQSWAQAGPGAAPAPGHAPAPPEPSPPPGGDVALRVIGSRPNQLGLYRFDQIVSSLARETLWLTDAYFVGTTAYVRALCDASRDGVDVRLLVPGSSDLPVAKALSRAGYRPLLQAGIRVFEWNGPMLHAKTAVADGRWARIGSSNLNLASWIGNWELDVAIENEGFAREMEAMFRHDLENATEIVLAGGRKGGRVRGRQPHSRRRGSPGRLAAGAVGLGSAVGAAITNHRTLGAAEARLMAAGGGLLVLLSGLALWWPRLLAVPVAALGLWLALSLFVRAWGLRREGGEAAPAPRGAEEAP